MHIIITIYNKNKFLPKSRDFRLFIYDKYNFPTFWQIYYKNEFKTKNEAKEYLRTMMKQYLNIGQKKISKDDVNFSFLRCLLLIGWNTKNEIEYFNVDVNEINKSTYHLVVKFNEDEILYPVGLMKYIDNMNKKEKVENKDKGLNDSLRKSINYQINNFRETAKMKCKICKEKHCKFHIDHIIKFRDLKTNFLKLNSNVPDIINDLKFGGMKFKNEDDEFVKEWKAYHLNNAKLRVLCQTCNLKEH